MPWRFRFKLKLQSVHIVFNFTTITFQILHPIKIFQIDKKSHKAKDNTQLTDVLQSIKMSEFKDHSITTYKVSYLHSTSISYPWIAIFHCRFTSNVLLIICFLFRNIFRLYNILIMLLFYNIILSYL